MKENAEIIQEPLRQFPSPMLDQGFEEIPGVYYRIEVTYDIVTAAELEKDENFFLAAAEKSGTFDFWKSPDEDIYS